jgi:serine protease AprX
MASFLVRHTKHLAQWAALWLAMLLVGAAFANNAKISPDLQPLLANPSNTVNVIVQYNAPQGCTGGGLLGGLLCSVENLLGGVVNVAFTLINAVAGTMQAGNVIALSNQSNVAYISLDRAVNASLDYTGDAVYAPYAWNSGLDGSGIGIAVIDSGIYPHPDLNSASGQSRIVYRQSFISGGVQNDDYGHGTHVAGIAAGNGSSSSMPGTLHLLKGIAPNANLLDLRVLDLNGASTDSIVIAAIQQAVNLKNQYNVRVINLSVGRQIFEGCGQDPLCQAVEAAWSNGIVVVTAAGNLGRNGYATITSPGNSPHAITVGCMKTLETYSRSDDEIASYSSKGPTYVDLTVKPDVVAPGNLVVSLLAPGSTLAAEYPANVVPPSYYTNSTGPAEYFRLSGTSMATPVVSGAAALMLQENPSLSPDTIKARLMKTATKNFPAYSVATDPTTGQTYIDFYDIFTIGAGYIDIQSALNDTDVANGSAESPSVMYNILTQQAVLVTNNNQIWGESASRNVVWGSGNVWGTNVVWGSSDFVGATAALQRGNVVWGSSGDWGTSTVWGTNVVWGSTSGNGEE